MLHKIEDKVRCVTWSPVDSYLPDGNPNNYPSTFNKLSGFNLKTPNILAPLITFYPVKGHGFSLETPINSARKCMTMFLTVRMNRNQCVLYSIHH